MRGIALATLLLLSPALAGCLGEDRLEITEDPNLIEKLDCEEREGSWVEATDRGEGIFYCTADSEQSEESNSPQDDCERRLGTWDEQTRECSFEEEIPLPDCELNNSCFEPEIFTGCMDQEALNYDGNVTEDDGSCEYEEQQSEPTYIPPCNVTASQGMNSTANPENWPELKPGKWADIEGLTQISYASPVNGDTELVVDTRLEWMCGYTYSVKPPNDYNDSKQYPIFMFLHGGVTNDWFFTNFLTNNFHIPENDSYIIVRPSKLEMDWNPKKVLDVLEDIKSQMNVDDDRVYLTGLSMGGRGTFIVAAELPDYFAAIMPLSPHHTPYSYLPLAEDVAHLPIWMSHGDSDNTSSYEMASQMAQELQNLGAEIEFHTVIDGGHEGWFSIYTDPVAMEWILSHVRGQ